VRGLLRERTEWLSRFDAIFGLLGEVRHGMGLLPCYQPERNSLRLCQVTRLLQSGLCVAVFAVEAKIVILVVWREVCAGGLRCSAYGGGRVSRCRRSLMDGIDADVAEAN